jgi:hypothetical protein
MHFAGENAKGLAVEREMIALDAKAMAGGGRDLGRGERD